MANVAAIRIEHTRLAEVEHAERMHAKELDQAAEIQRELAAARTRRMFQASIWPDTMPPAGPWAATTTISSRIPTAALALLVGDVAGKGMPAALLMSSLQARVQVLFDDPDDLAELVTRLNRIITSNCPTNRFITFFHLASLDPKTGELVYVNAGHNPPLVAHDEWFGGEAGRHRRDLGHSADGPRINERALAWTWATWWCFSAMASPRRCVPTSMRSSAKTGWRTFWWSCSNQPRTGDHRFG